MLASDLLNQYIRQHPYGISDAAINQLRWTLNLYTRFCGSSRVKLDVDAANQWLDDLRATRAQDTVRTQRGNLLTLWRWAYQESLTDEPPLRVRKLRPIRRAVRAWTLPEVRLLLAVADRAGPWWSSLCRVGYDTGLRLGDLLRLQVGQILGNQIGVGQHKTSRPVSVRLRHETAIAVTGHLDGRTEGLVWPWPYRREAFYRGFRRLVAAAAIRPGTFRWLRRTAATQCERVQPGSGTLLLGHASRSTTEAWYLDRSQLGQPPL